MSLNTISNKFICGKGSCFIPKTHHGHRARIKKEFKENGLSHFPDHKMLELLLYYSIPRRDTNELGHNLINRFGSLSGVFDAPINLLLETEGIGEETATLIKFVSELCREYLKDYTDHHNTISDTESAKSYMEHQFIGESIENIVIACLAHNGKVVFFDVLSKGSPETVNVQPVIVVKTALKANAIKVVLAHNHPHGICTPSSTDLRTTNILYQELKRVDIELFDHIIVANNGVYSMRENGLLPD